MGAYLSEPVLEKQTEDGENGRMKYGATGMQGWRINQEDAHNCICDFDDDASLFAVYDGHGGSDVSTYTATHFPNFLKTIETYKEGKFGQALEDAFLEFDKHLLSESATAELRLLAGTKEEKEKSDDDREDGRLLLEEAHMPLEEILMKYGLRFRKAGAVCPQSSAKAKFLSPNVKKKKQSKSRLPDSLEVTCEENGGVIPPGNLELEDEEGPKTPPSSPDHGSSLDKRAVKRTFSGEAKKPETDPDQITTPPPPPVTDAIMQPKRFKEADGEPGTDGNGNQERETVNGNKDTDLEKSVNLQNEATSQSKDTKTDIRRSVSEVSVSGPGTEAGDSSNNSSSANVTVPVVIRQNQDDSSVQSRTIQQAVTGRNRSSKSESELKFLKMEDDTQGPVTNWKNFDHLGKEGDPPGRSTGTPETATAASSSDGDEESEDEDFRMDQESVEGEDSDGLDSSSSVDKSVSDEDEESMEEGDEGGIPDEMGIELEPDEDDEDEDMFPVPSGDTPGVDSGTTACVALVKSNRVYVANAGDSRCVLCRGGKALDLSVDHKPEDHEEKDRIEKAGGKITGDGRVNGGLNLSRAIGDHFYKKNDALPLKDQMISACPDISVETLKPEDEFMVMACDGIWNSLSSQTVVDFVKERLAKNDSLGSICEQLCDHCLAPNTAGDGTGCDNMTVVVVTFKRNSEREETGGQSLVTQSPVVNGQSDA